MTIKQWIVTISIILGIIILIMSIKTYINGEISKQTQNLQENHVKILADTKLQCENEKIDETTELKKQIVELQSEISKLKLLLDKIKRQGKITNDIKRDVNSFIKQFDDLTGAKGKNNANK